MTLPCILRLDRAGTPLDWISVEDAVCHMVKDHIMWALGDTAWLMRGGTGRNGVLDGFSQRGLSKAYRLL